MMNELPVCVDVPVGETHLTFQVADGGGGPWFALGVRKSGSTLFHRTVNFLARANGVTVVDVPGTFFQNGFNATHWAGIDAAPLIRPGNLYSGFRNFPAAFARTPAWQDAPKAFMFRDPRDALVSQYFSDAYSHSLPKADASGDGRAAFEAKRAEAQGTDIDGWVVAKAQAMRRTMMEYVPLLSDPTCLALRYENYVFQKRRLIAKLLRQYGWQVADAALDGFLDEIDQVPTTQDDTRFIRRVIPGDHVAKLRRDTIAALNERLADVLRAYDYH